MKKTLIILALIGVILLPALGRAATVEELTAQTNTLIQQLITLLTQEIARLQAQLAEMVVNQVAQNATIQQQAQVLGSIQQNTEPIVSAPVVVPEVKKEIKVDVDTDRDPWRTPRIYQMSAFYFENGKRVNTNISVSSDKGDYLQTSDKCSATEGVSITCSTQRSGYDGLPVVYFNYLANATGTRVLTISANGLTKAVNLTGPIEARQ